MSPPLPNAAQAFMDGAPDADRAELLAALAPEGWAALLSALTDAGQRSHLEAIGRSSAPRAIAKAARKAAYVLKSRGVGAAPRRAPARAAPADDAELAAIVTPPGLAGLCFLMTRSMRGAGGVVVRGEGFGDVSTVEPLGELSAGRLRATLALTDADRVPGLPMLASADLAVRMIDALVDIGRLAGAGYPAAWPHLLAWRDAALEGGADPRRACARDLLADELRALPDALRGATASLADEPACGVPMPAPHVAGALLDHAPEVIADLAGQPEERVRREVISLAHAHGDRWLADGATRPLVTACLEATADTLLARDLRPQAVRMLYVCDQLRAGAPVAEIGYLARVFEHLVDRPGDTALSTPT